LDVEHEEIVALTTFVVKGDPGSLDIGCQPSDSKQPSGGIRAAVERGVAYCVIQRSTLPSYGFPIGHDMAAKLDVKQGTLALMILKTLEVLGPLHGYGVGRRIEETSKHRLTLNYGTLYPALLKLEQEGLVTAEWRQSENNRRAKYYALTAAGRKQLAREARDWHRTADLIAAFIGPRREVP
jgi:PadR family transcriptional regulator PadR